MFSPTRTINECSLYMHYSICIIDKPIKLRAVYLYNNLNCVTFLAEDHVSSYKMSVNLPPHESWLWRSAIHRLILRLWSCFRFHFLLNIIFYLLLHTWCFHTEVQWTCMEIVDHSKDGFNIRIDSFILILISCSSSHSKVQSPTVILTVSSLLFSHKSQCTMSALRTPTRKKYLRKRIKTEEAF